ncbi:MAG: tRNA/rRNA methyltransferase [Salinivirgaceae bacterium]|jgi:tRNA/rRNA methyltransferase|nr:tRNA/rRNA methyltransferase [Salinivirgaceae bacterium]
MDIVFVLTEPAVPENIGAAARAIKTMGFGELRIVNSHKHLEKEAKWLAHGSAEVLENAKTYGTFKGAIADLDFTLATTAKNRSVKLDYYTPEEAKEILLNKTDAISKVGIIFGREESGLKNEELAVCDLAVTIPIKAKYPSINLAQSVMIMAYVFTNCELKEQEIDNNKYNYVLLKQKTQNSLKLLNIKEGENLFGRIMERLALINTPDINLFLSIIGRFEKFLNKSKNE